MKRTTVKIPEALDAQLRSEAQRRGLTISELTRVAIESYLNPPRRTLGSIGAGASTDGRSLAEHFDELMSQTMDERYRRKTGRD